MKKINLKSILCICALFSSIYLFSQNESPKHRVSISFNSNKITIRDSTITDSLYSNKFPWWYLYDQSIDFGDGSPIINLYGHNNFEFSHIYSKTGLYKIKLYKNFVDIAKDPKKYPSDFNYDVKINSLNHCSSVSSNLCLDDYIKNHPQFEADIVRYSSGSNTKHYWNFGDGSTYNIVNPVNIYKNPGDYQITYIVTDTINNCSDTANLSINVNNSGKTSKRTNFEFKISVVDKLKDNLSIPENNESHNINFKIYPNPSNNQLNLIMPTSFKGTQKIEIFNLQGQLVNALSIETENASFDVSTLTSGLYVIKVSSMNGASGFVKFIKQ